MSTEHIAVNPEGENGGLPLRPITLQRFSGGMKRVIWLQFALWPLC